MKYLLEQKWGKWGKYTPFQAYLNILSLVFTRCWSRKKFILLANWLPNIHTWNFWLLRYMPDCSQLIRKVDFIILDWIWSEFGVTAYSHTFCEILRFLNWSHLKNKLTNLHIFAWGFSSMKEKIWCHHFHLGSIRNAVVWWDWSICKLATYVLWKPEVHCWWTFHTTQNWK